MRRLKHVVQRSKSIFIFHALPPSLRLHLSRFALCSSTAETANNVKELSLDELLSSAVLDDVPTPQNDDSFQQKKQSVTPMIDPNLLEESDALKSDAFGSIDDVMNEMDALSEDDDDDEIDRIIDEIEAEHQSNDSDPPSNASPNTSDALTVSTASTVPHEMEMDEHRPALSSTASDLSTFRSMGLRKKLERNLHSVHGLSPLPIQSLAFEKVGSLQREYAISGSILESGMGTGKTLAYLLPILNDLKPLQCGQAVIVVPSHELGVQIKAMIKSYLIHHDDFRRNWRNSSYLGNNHDAQKKRERQFLLQHAVMSCGSTESLDFNMDYISKMSPAVIIGTPKRIRELLLYSVLKPSRIQYIVFDEVDTLFPIKSKYEHKNKQRRHQQLEHSHLKPSQLILNGILRQQPADRDDGKRNGNHHRCHALFVGATIPNQLKSFLRQILQPHPVQLISTHCPSPTEQWRTLSKDGEMEQFAANPVHRLISPNIAHQYVAVDGAENKPFIVAELIRKIRLNPKQKKMYNPAVLVFVAKESSPMEFAESLSEHDLKCAVLHEHCAEKAARSRFLKMFRSGKIEAVVATESVARGLDFIWLDHVIVAEVPFQDTSYLHIAGRCSRLDSKGFVTSVVDEFDEDRLKRHCFKYNIALRELDEDAKIEALSKQRRRYNKLNTFPLLLQNKAYQKKLKQQLYLTKTSVQEKGDREQGEQCL